MGRERKAALTKRWVFREVASACVTSDPAVAARRAIGSRSGSGHCQWACVLHHGGSGTVAACLAEGVPQLVAPRM